jgi:leader peptidase (prepilin peptidase) / N-methyltransferase
MEWWFHIPLALWTFWILLLGLGVGSFMNVLIARLPYEKSLIWPSSTCFTCYRKIGLMDNLPIIGYLRLRGRCRKCKAPYSARYMWVEIFTGLAFVALFWIEIVANVEDGPKIFSPWLKTPGLKYNYLSAQNVLPHWKAWVFFFSHAALLFGLLASAIIDAKHKIIPLPITYIGTLVGLIVNVCFPWPFPNTTTDILHLPVNKSWMELSLNTSIPNGIAMWPFWGPWPSWAAPGTPMMGLMTGLMGAAAGLAIGRGIKILFEAGMKRDALGLGDADLLMMAGAFLGWQTISLALPIGAMLTLIYLIPLFIVCKLCKKPFDGVPPFGPGIAAGVVVCWLGWPWLGELVRAAYFDLLTIGILLGVVCVSFLLSGFLLRRGPEPVPSS